MISYSSLPEEEPLAGRSAESRLTALPSWIRSELRGDLSVPQLAHRACLSPRHFTRIFKRLFNATPACFVEQLRVTEAALRLAAENATIDEIADAVGFKSADVFRRAFERRYGLPPRRFRRQILGEPSPAKKRHIRRRRKPATDGPTST